MIGYKAFESDMTCKGFQYEVGKTYETDEEIELCKSGFHFCEKIADCFRYYKQLDARFAKVEALGDVIRTDDETKCVTNKIRILEEIPRDEAVRMSNTGDRNTGNWNTGNRNTGNRNTGDCNTGDRNTGDWNTGDWNTGDWNTSNYNSGCFMTIEPTIQLFNKQSDWTLRDWIDSRAREILRNVPQNIDITKWIDVSGMTDAEKEEHPESKTTDGYLKVTKIAADRQAWWDMLDEDDKQTVMSLPNFDAKIFYECTGIGV